MSMHDNVLDKIKNSIEFLIEVEHLKSIYRRARVKFDSNRKENSAEHSWYVAISAPILKNFLDIEVDINKVIQMLLIRDIVEIYTGDMFAFENSKTRDSHKLKENEAIEELCNKHNLQQVFLFKALWQEFEDCVTNEAKFARSVDRIMPFIQNMNNNGGSWSEYGTTKSQILQHNKILKEISLELWAYVNIQLQIAVSQGWVKNI